MSYTKALRDYIEEIKNINERFIQYLEDDDSCDEILKRLIFQMNDLKIFDNKHEFSIILHLISELSHDHFRFQSFCSKIEHFFTTIIDDIKKNFTNLEIFEIFLYNKRLILLLLENGLIIPDQQIADKITENIFISRFYPEYFYPEFKSFISSEYKEYFYNDSDEFYLKRKTGENDNYICKLIQQDAVADFITYINQADISITSKINFSIYETNSFLLENKPTLLEYAAFYGSYQIVKYLQTSGAELTSSLWLYAIHSNNAELINFLEENLILPNGELYEVFIKESINCHLNNVTTYFRDNYASLNECIKISSLLNQIITSYNFIELYNIFNDESFNILDWSQIDKETSEFNTSILYDFFNCDYYKIVVFLINNTNIDINALITCFKKTTLISAIEKNSLDYVQILLSHPNIDVNYISMYFMQGCYYKNSALCIAVQNNDFEITKLLLSNPNIDVNLETLDYDKYRSVSKKTSLSIAIENNFIEIAKLLITHPNIDINKQIIISDRTTAPLNLAVEKNHIEILKLLLKHQKIDVNLVGFYNIVFSDEYETALGIAIKNNNIKALKLLLDHPNINPNSALQDKYGDKPLNIAVKNENIEAIKLLLSKPTINPNIESISKDKIEIALNIAIKSNNIEIVQLLLEHPKINVNYESNRNHNKKTPLNIAIENENMDIIKLLLKKSNIDVNCRSILKNREETALGIAIKKNNIEIIQLLLENPKIDVNPQQNLKNIEMPLAIAVHNKNIEIIKMLLKCPKINVNAISTYENIKESALNISVKNNDIEITKILLSQPNINVNNKFIIEKDGHVYEEETPLISALKNKNNEIVKLLLSNPNIDINYRSKSDYHKETALTIAVRDKNLEIVILLVNHPKIDVNIVSLNNIKEETALTIAINNRDYEIINLILQKHQIKSKPKSHICLSNINYIQKGYISSDLNHYKYEFETELCAAVKYNDIQIVNSILMNTDVNVNQKSIYFDNNYIKIKTALNIAIENENIEIIKKLLQHPNININLSSFSFEINGIYDYFESEKCPIHVAIEKSNMNIIKLLVSHPQININSKMFSFKGKDGDKDSVEKNALHMAIEQNNLDLIKFLITIPKLNVNSKATYGSEYIYFLFDENHVVLYNQSKNHVVLNNQSENRIAFDPKQIFCKKRLLTPLSIDFKIHKNHKNSEIKQILLTRSDFDSNNKSDFYCDFYSFSYKDRLGVKYESYDYSENDNEMQIEYYGYDFPLK